MTNYQRKLSQYGVARIIKKTTSIVVAICYCIQYTGIADGRTKDHFKLGFRRNFFFVSRTIRRGIIIVLLASSHLQKNEFTPVSLINIIRYVNLRHVGSDPRPGFFVIF